MAGISLKHQFVSGLPDNATSTQVQPSNWNAEHALALDQFNLIGRVSAGNGAAEEVPCTSVAMTLLAAPTQLAMRAALGQMQTADIGLLQVTGAQIANSTITATQLAGITAQSMTVSAQGKNAPLNLWLAVAIDGTGGLKVSLVTAAGLTPSVTDPVQIMFRNVTAASGQPTLVTVNTATSITIPSGAHLGVPNNATPFRVWVVAINNAGTVILGVVVCSAIVGNATVISPAINNEGALITATAISGAATTPGVVYASAGVGGKAFRIIGYFDYEAGLPNAGIWSVDRTTTNLFGPGDNKPGTVVQTISLSLASGVASQAITPTSAINMVRVSAKADLTLGGGGSATLNRGATALDVVALGGSGPAPLGPVLDNPASASAQTYSISTTGGASVTKSFIYLDEIMG